MPDFFKTISNLNKILLFKVYSSTRYYFFVLRTSIIKHSKLIFKVPYYQPLQLLHTLAYVPRKHFPPTPLPKVAHSISQDIILKHLIDKLAGYGQPVVATHAGGQIKKLELTNLIARSIRLYPVKVRLVQYCLVLKAVLYS